MTTNANTVDGFEPALTILNSLPHPVLIADADLRVRFVNGVAAESLGYAPPELHGESIVEIVSEQFSTFARQMARQIHSEGARATDWHQFTIGLRHKSGSEIPAEVSVSTLEVEGERFLICSCRERHTTPEIGEYKHSRHGWLDNSQGIVPVGGWRWDVDTDRVTWSSELYRIFGISPETTQLTYEEYLTFIHPDDRDYVRTTVDRAFSQGLSFDIEHRIVRPDGTVRVIHGQGAADNDEDGNLRSMVGVARDITDRKAYEEQQFQLALEQTARQEAERASERFQFLAGVSEALGSTLESDAMLDHLMDLIIPDFADWCTIHTLTGTGTIKRLATAHRDPEKRKLLESIRAHGFFPDQEDSHPLTRVVRHGEPELYDQVTDDMLMETSRSDEYLEQIRDMNLSSVILVPMLARGRAFGVMVYGMSESGRRFTQSDLELATEITHRAATSIDNASLYQEAQEAARAREEFVSMVSHELKTPLTAIKGYLQVLGRHLDRSEWERERILGTRERLDTQVQRLELLVSDILDASRIQLGRLGLNFQPDTDLVEVARQVVNRFDEAIERTPDHVIHVHADGPVCGRWDAMRLDQVLSNLISNALKYSPEGGSVCVEIGQEGDHGTVKVSDEGIGINETERKHLFQPFHRGTATVRGISGTGLGLYITKQIVEEHAGQISVDSAPGSHTAIRIRLPLDPTSVFDAQNDLSPEASGDGHVQFE